MSKPFRRGMFNHIELAVGEPVPAAEAAPSALQARVTALRGDLR